MSREIKFRAKGQVYPKWFYGNDLWDLGIYSDIEVIGNIHENPEILEKNND